MEKMLPHNTEAEKGYLGSLIIDPEAFAQASYLKPEDFARSAHRVIYKAIMALYRKGEVADFITICDELERTGALEDAGGASYLTGLINVVPTSGNVDYYAKIVARTALQRKIIHAGAQIAALGYEDDPESLTKAGQIIFNLHAAATQAAFEPLSQLAQDYIEELVYLQEHYGNVLGVPTGYRDLDKLFGGLQKTDLILLAGRPGMGKTAFALCMTLNAALAGKRVAFFSLEMSKKLLMRRLASMRSKIDMQRLRMGWLDDEQWEGIMAAVTDLSRLPIWICDVAGNPVSSMRHQLRQLISTHFDGAPVDLVVVDYLGLIEPDEDAGRYQQMVHQIDAICRGLKGLAREFDVPVLALCQLSRKCEERANKRPLISDLRDSGALEQHADAIMFIYRDDYYAQQENRESEKPGIAEVHVAKHRNGPVGGTELWWEAGQTAFYDINYEEESA
jgi:replicative DNA helicase